MRAKTIVSIQEVKNLVEQMALEVAKIYVEDSQKAASARVKELAAIHGLTYCESVVLTHVATCMIYGKRWKKGP